jgi:predicted regulator of Ras-like GTPase activity (Roadblock/LC7/MglB family)
MDAAVYGLLPGAIPGELYEYLKTTADLAGIYVLDVDMEEVSLTLADLDADLGAKMITLDELAQRVAENRVVAVF